MKKILSMLFVIITLVSSTTLLVSCGGSSESEPENPADPENPIDKGFVSETKLLSEIQISGVPQDEFDKKFKVGNKFSITNINFYVYENGRYKNIEFNDIDFMKIKTIISDDNFNIIEDVEFTTTKKISYKQFKMSFSGADFIISVDSDGVLNLEYILPSSNTKKIIVDYVAKYLKGELAKEIPADELDNYWNGKFELSQLFNNNLFIKKIKQSGDMISESKHYSSYFEYGNYDWFNLKGVGEVEWDIFINGGSDTSTLRSSYIVDDIREPNRYKIYKFKGHHWFSIKLKKDNYFNDTFTIVNMSIKSSSTEEYINDRVISPDSLTGVYKINIKKENLIFVDSEDKKITDLFEKEINNSNSFEFTIKDIYKNKKIKFYVIKNGYIWWMENNSLLTMLDKKYNKAEVNEKTLEEQLTLAYNDTVQRFVKSFFR